MKNLALVGLGAWLIGCGGGAAAPTMDAAVVDVVVETVAEVAEDVTPDLGPTMVNFGLTEVIGTFSGDAVNVQSATRTDTLALKSCTFTSTGTAPNQMALLGAAALLRPLSVTGTWSCPAGMATSTGGAPCMTQASMSTTNMLQVAVEAAGWEDDSSVTFTVTYPPGVISACNYAGVVVAAPGWGMTGTTTAGKFKALMPFTVTLAGAKALTSGTTTSNVSWDFAMTVAPSL